MDDTLILSLRERLYTLVTGGLEIQAAPSSVFE